MNNLQTFPVNVPLREMLKRGYKLEVNAEFLISGWEGMEMIWFLGDFNSEGKLRCSAHSPQMQHYILHESDDEDRDILDAFYAPDRIFIQTECYLKMDVDEEISKGATGQNSCL